jgi:predicted HAD superfamily Cof-like phosphohydrolase
MTLLEQAIAFRQAFGQDIMEGFAPDGFIRERLYNMQARLIEEEVQEFDEAATLLKYSPNDLSLQIEVLKELCDVVYVAYQFAAAFGLDLDTAMQRVYESNMSKLDDDGKPIYREDGKVLKGPNYKKPVLDDLITISHRTYDTSGK